MAVAEPNLDQHWQVVDRRVRATYDLYRTSLLNKKYYGDRLEAAKRWSLILECALVVGTSGAIAAWAAWKTALGSLVWAAITALSTVIAVLKPILQLPNKIERYTSLYTGHADLYFDIKQLVDEIQDRRDFTDEMWTTVRRAQERVKELGLKDDPKPRPRLQRKFYEEVTAEIPADKLWWGTPAHGGAVGGGGIGS